MTDFTMAQLGNNIFTHARYRVFDPWNEMAC